MKSRLLRAGSILAVLLLCGPGQAETPLEAAQQLAAKRVEELRQAHTEAQQELNCNPPLETIVVSSADCAKYLNPDVDPAITTKHVCANCHANDGNSTLSHFPRLAGQQQAYLANQLIAFQKHTRSGQGARDYMWGIASPLTAGQIDALADHFTRQSPSSNPISDADRPRLELGRQIFENGIPGKKVLPCGFCHGPQAQGLRAFPRLASQHSAYTEKALGEYKENITRPGTPMRQITRDMSPEEMRDVALYVQSLP